MRAALAGLAYFASIFVAGIGLGTARVLVLQPQVGPVAAVLVELPIILGLAWWTCRKLIEQLRVPRHPGSAMVMGGVAFLLLMAAETGLALWTPGRSASELLALYREPAAMLGLAGQILFAFFPLLQVERASRLKEAKS